MAADGGLFAFTAPFHGSMGGKPLNKPIVGMASTRPPAATGGGRPTAGSSASTAPFHGSMGGKPLNQPIVGMAFDTVGPAATGEVAADGGLFAFTAPFYGSMGGKPLNKPVVGMDDPGTGKGYWMVATDGGIFSFTVPFFGSMGGKPLTSRSWACPPPSGGAVPATSGRREVRSDLEETAVGGNEGKGDRWDEVGAPPRR